MQLRGLSGCKVPCKDPVSVALFYPHRHSGVNGKAVLFEMRRALTTYAAVLQVVALLLLQWYAIIPHLGRIQVRTACSGDHRLCGCAPERVAAHACCCFQRAPSCCDPKGGHHDAHAAQHEEDASTSFLSSAPCGDPVKFVSASLDKLKFMGCASLPLIPANCSSEFPFPPSERSSSRFREPPVPPPRIVVSA